MTRDASDWLHDMPRVYQAEAGFLARVRCTSSDKGAYSTRDFRVTSLYYRLGAVENENGPAPGNIGVDMPTRLIFERLA